MFDDSRILEAPFQAARGRKVGNFFIDKQTKIDAARRRFCLLPKIENLTRSVGRSVEWFRPPSPSTALVSAAASPANPRFSSPAAQDALHNSNLTRPKVVLKGTMLSVKR